MRRNDPPGSVVDTIAQRHDIDYSLAEDLPAVRIADQHTLSSGSFKKAKAGGDLNTSNITVAQAAIGSKVFAEDYLGLDKGLFVNPKDTVNTPADVALDLEEATRQVDSARLRV